MPARRPAGPDTISPSLWLASCWGLSDFGFAEVGEQGSGEVAGEFPVTAVFNGDASILKPAVPVESCRVLVERPDEHFTPVSCEGLFKVLGAVAEIDGLEALGFVLGDDSQEEFESRRVARVRATENG